MGLSRVVDPKPFMHPVYPPTEERSELVWNVVVREGFVFSQ
jgi:hypothetical protein